MAVRLCEGWCRIRLILVASLLLFVCLVGVTLIQAQPQDGKSAVSPSSLPPVAPPAPAPDSGAPVGSGTQPAPQPVPMPASFPPPQRFTFTIDPKTPLKDLLPTPPRFSKPDRPALTEDLSRVPEIQFQSPLASDLNVVEATRQTAHTIARINFLNGKKTDGFLVALRKERADLLGLAFAMGDECRTRGERNRQLTNAVNLVRQCLRGDMSVNAEVRQFVSMTSGTVERVFVQAVPAVNPQPTGPGQPAPPSPGAAAPPAPPVPAVAAPPAPRPQSESFWENYITACANEDKNVSSVDREQLDHMTAARIAALMQILGPESPSLRRGLVKHLSGITHVEATRALARLTIFTAEDEVRLAAVDALKVRRERDYTSILLSGMRYPYPAVARRAADALVKLERHDLIPQLLEALDQSDPRAPETREFDGKKAAVVRELVRINHHRNCLLCHAPGNSGGVSSESLTAQVPVPSEPLPSPSDGYRNSSPDVVVRIDVTYLRQDFSLRQPVEDANPWPEMQRFDYLVRTRVLTEQEAETHRELFSNREPGVLSPYHKAALVALRELTGKDTEPTAEAWRKLLAIPRPKRTASF